MLQNQENMPWWFLYTLEHLIPDGYAEIPTFALYHPLLTKNRLWKQNIDQYDMK